MRKAVLFDLGGTLVAYYEREEFPSILSESINLVKTYLKGEGFLKVPERLLWEKVDQENHESEDYKVRPLEGRLARIFGIPIDSLSSEQIEGMCRKFLIPIFRVGRCYNDCFESLETLRKQGYKTAIVSNTPWGSPAELWREEVARHGLNERVDFLIFCRDVGWRKPAEAIFKYVLDQLRVKKEECVFVGDSIRWDIQGARVCGIDAILIDRSGKSQNSGENTIRNLVELVHKLEKDRGA